MEIQKSSIGVGILAAVASSLCCITPLVAILAGSSSLASNFQWVEPLRPWLIGAAVVALGAAWYLHLRPPQDDCGCPVDKPGFWHGRPFLGGVTLLSALLLTFPLYADALYPSAEPAAVEVADSTNIEALIFSVKGMTCAGCERHVEHAVARLEGVISVTASYENHNAHVQFDKTRLTAENIKTAIESTSYQVVDTRPLPDQNNR